jgi:predicted PurR-regulated permease PerM
VIYLLRKPIGWIVLATFIAVAMSAPVNLLARHMHRGLAIALSYLGLLAIPVLLALILVPPIVNGIDDLATKAPDYAAQAQDYVQKNKTLRKLEDDYGVITQLEEQAKKLPQKLGTAAGTLSNIGVGVVNSVFALVTILILSIFMVADGRRWVLNALSFQPAERRESLDRALSRISTAVANYVGGALAQATIAGITSFIVMKILGIPFAAPLAVIVGFADLIPLIGATIAAVLVGIVTIFADFPIDTIIWVIWAVVYQQLENSVIQPQIQRRAVDLHPFLVLVSVLFGAKLFGVAGALLAIPGAASVQIAATEWWQSRQSARPEALPEA